MTKSRLLQSHVPDQMRRIRTGRSLTLLTGDKVKEKKRKREGSVIRERERAGRVTWQLERGGL